MIFLNGYKYMYCIYAIVTLGQGLHYPKIRTNLFYGIHPLINHHQIVFFVEKKQNLMEVRRRKKQVAISYRLQLCKYII